MRQSRSSRNRIDYRPTRECVTIEPTQRLLLHALARSLWVHEITIPSYHKNKRVLGRDGRKGSEPLSAATNTVVSTSHRWRTSAVASCNDV